MDSVKYIGIITGIYMWNMKQKGFRSVVDYDAKRPRNFLIPESINILFKYLNIQRAGFFTVQVFYSEYIILDDLTIRNNVGGHSPSTDGGI